MSQLHPGQAVTSPTGLSGHVVAIFDAGNLGTAATVQWHTETGARTQYNVGTGWLTGREDLPAREVSPLSLGDCTVCGTTFTDVGRAPDRYGTCGYGQCVEAAWPQFAYVPRPDRVDAPHA